ncbi:hypothetical protein NL50_12240 [Clostridium acetobutylicum]|nr:hypothetical protein NL50_12240 [Clostridium acetobutylicum]
MINKILIPTIAFIIFIIFIILSFKKSYKSNNMQFDINKEGSIELKGIAIMCVIIGHLCMWGFIKIPFVSFLGAQGVELFLFISGYGLTKSYIRNGIDRTYFIKRIKKVFMPYFIVTIIIILVNIWVIGAKLSIRTIFLWLIGLNIKFDGSMWYISFIMFWYIVFFIIFKPNMNNKIRIVILFFISSLMFYFSQKSSKGDLNNEYISHCFMFPIGCFWSIYSDRIFKKINNKITTNNIILFMKVTSFICLFIIFPISYKLINVTVFYLLCNLSFTIAIIMIILIYKYYNCSSKFLEFVGKIAFEIYLIEGIFMYKYSVLKLINVKIISIILFLLFVIIIASLLNKIFKYVLKFQ